MLRGKADECYYILITLIRPTGYTGIDGNKCIEYTLRSNTKQLPSFRYIYPRQGIVLQESGNIIIINISYTNYHFVTLPQLICASIFLYQYFHKSLCSRKL